MFDVGLTSIWAGLTVKVAAIVFRILLSVREMRSTRRGVPAKNSFTGPAKRVAGRLSRLGSLMMLAGWFAFVLLIRPLWVAALLIAVQCPLLLFLALRVGSDDDFPPRALDSPAPAKPVGPPAGSASGDQAPESGGTPML